MLRRLVGDRRLLSILHVHHGNLIREWLEQLLASSSTLSAAFTIRSPPVQPNFNSNANSKSKTKSKSKSSDRSAIANASDPSDDVLLAMVYILRPLIAIDRVACGCVFSVARKLRFVALVTCHLSLVTCHLSLVTCHLSLDH